MPPKSPYPKPATTYTQQITILRNRGMLIANEDIAKSSLSHCNYYRLRAYWLPFEDGGDSHNFVRGTRFEDVLRLYDFDRELRLTLLDAIERIEISVRAQWAYRVGHCHGTHAHLDKSIAQNYRHWQRNKADLKKEVDRADEVFIDHLVSKYSEELPPIWAICEVMSLGLLSRWYANLKPMHTRSLIAGSYGCDQAVFQSWLHHLSIVRNTCAHHSRLWNRDFLRVSPMIPQSKPKELVGLFNLQPKLYNSLLIMLFFMDKINPDHQWRNRLKQLILEHMDLITDMGFPNDWENLDIWN